MLLPRYTTRTLLVLTTVCAFFFLGVRLALMGHSWALGLVSGVGAVLLLLLLSPLMFYLALAINAMFSPVRALRPAPPKTAAPPVVMAEDAE